MLTSRVDFLNKQFDERAFNTVYFTEDEKEFQTSRLKMFKREGRVDKEIMPYVDRINSLPWALTISSCTGHGKFTSGAHLVIRIRMPFEKFFEIIKGPAARVHLNNIHLRSVIKAVTMHGIQNGWPAFKFHFHEDAWESEVEDLVSTLEEANTWEK
jgi:hypothetical protein